MQMQALPSMRFIREMLSQGSENTEIIFYREIKGKGNENCMKFKKDGKVHHKKCSDSLRAICGRKSS